MRFLDFSWSRGPRQEAGNSVVRSAQGRGTSVQRQSKKIRKKGAEAFNPHEARAAVRGYREEL